MFITSQTEFYNEQQEGQDIQVQDMEDRHHEDNKDQYEADNVVEIEEEEFIFTNIKEGNIIQCTDPNSTITIECRVINRAGKKMEKNKHWWNIENTNTGEAASYNSKVLKDPRKVADEQVMEENPEETFLVVLPR